MKIAYLGAGVWGVCLANLLANKGHDVTLWTIDPEFVKTRKHPRIADFTLASNLKLTTDLKEALLEADMVVESVTAAGIRPVFTEVKKVADLKCPIVLTSKGIEQGSGFLLHEILGDMGFKKELIGCISGPSIALEVLQKLPTSVVGSAYDAKLMALIVETFTTETFRVYPNGDIVGVSFGGAMKNIIALACGISDGLGFGDNTKAAIMTRGLHEIKKLSVMKKCVPETLYGLSGMGDLCVTCLSTHSRNYSFGRLIAKGIPVSQAKEDIGMVVEGMYTCVSALELGRKGNVALPITEGVYAVLNEGLDPKSAVKRLLSRTVKEEHL